MSAPRELAWRELPLNGTTLIEASAGTGKTWNIALLHLRLLLERGLTVRQILVTTFTDAAADELKARIRLRLQDAERVALKLADGTAFATDDQELADFIADRVAVEGSESLLARLRLAQADVDLAPISTIHSFCRRVLTEFPFDTGVAFALGEVADEATLVRECVEDFWRQSFFAPTVDPWYAALVLPQGLATLAARVAALIAAPQAERLSVSTLPLREWWAQFALADQSALVAALDQLSSFKNGTRSGLHGALKALLAAVAAGDPAGVPWSLLARVLTHDKLNWAWKKSPTRPFIHRREFQALMAARELFVGVELRFVQEAACRAAEFTAQQLQLRLRARGQSSFSQWIAEVHDRLHGTRGDALAQRLAQTWPAALIDEFQDTDARQWAIFRRLYAQDSARTLILIGDPKQSIYAFRGGDIHTYLAAREQLPADRVYSIQRNFRSHPDLLAALNRIYQLAGSVAFGASGIDYVAVSPGRPASFATAVLPPLVLRLLNSVSGNVTDRDPVALAACADDIARMLNDPAARIGAERVVPGHIAVLVDTNHQLRQMRALLIQRRVPVVGAGRAHVLDTEWAQDLQLLLHALLHPGDEHAVRGALATRLLGVSASELRCMATDGGAWEDTLERFCDWRQDWERRGILAVIEAIIAEQAPRLLAAADGERALTNLRHLGELLQNAAAECYGPQELYQWLMRARESGDQQEAARDMQLRIESEARRVQLLTIHASKGLEFPIVFLPLAWRYRSERNDVGKDLARFHDAEHRLVLDLGTPQFATHKLLERIEDLQERLRQLYVALTRACHATRLYAFDDLKPGVDADDPKRSGLDLLLAAALASVADAGGNPWDALAALVPTLALDTSEPVFASYSVVDAGQGRRRQARAPQPDLREPYGLYSFSALTRAAPTLGDGERGAEDEVSAELSTPSVETAPHSALLALERVKGPRFGDAIHLLLEQGPGELPFAQQPGRIAQALAAQAVRLDAERSAEQLAAIARMLDRTLETPLAEGLSLGALTPAARRAEFEFAFALDAARWGQLHRVLAAHGLGDWWPQVEAGRQLRGLMKGYVDLVFAFDGRYHVLDYKTNFLGTRTADYRSEALDLAMRAHHYGLQALIYTVALHRYLGRRIDDYDPQRHLGESWYLFVRAIGLGADAGVWRRRFPPALIGAVDALFDGAQVSA